MVTQGQFEMPSVTQGFGTQYYQTAYLQAFMYDLSNNIFYAVYPQQQYDVFLQVMLTVARGFAVANKQLPGTYNNPAIPDPDILFTSTFFTPASASQADIATESGLDIITESGVYLITEQVANGGFFTQVTSQYPRCLLTENGAPILAENGDYIVLN